MRVVESMVAARRAAVLLVLAALGYRAAEDFNASLPKSRLPLEVVVSEV